MDGNTEVTLVIGLILRTVGHVLMTCVLCNPALQLRPLRKLVGGEFLSELEEWSGV